MLIYFVFTNMVNSPTNSRIRQPMDKQFQLKEDLVNVLNRGLELGVDLDTMIGNIERILTSYSLQDRPNRRTKIIEGVQGTW